MKSDKLHNIKSTGFKIPETYFETIEDAIFAKLAEETLCAKIDSSGFKVPNDYFETLDAKVLTAVSETNPVKVVSLFRLKKAAYISGIAASIILAINIFSTNSNNLKFNELETASIENYLLNENLDAYDIAPYFNYSELSSDDFVENTLKASDIEDYLLQNSDVENLITD